MSDCHLLLFRHTWLQQSWREILPFIHSLSSSWVLEFFRWFFFYCFVLICSFFHSPVSFSPPFSSSSSCHSLLCHPLFISSAPDEEEQRTRARQSGNQKRAERKVSASSSSTESSCDSLWFLPPPLLAWLLIEIPGRKEKLKQKKKFRKRLSIMCCPTCFCSALFSTPPSVSKTLNRFLRTSGRKEWRKKLCSRTLWRRDRNYTSFWPTLSLAFSVSAINHFSMKSENQ